MDVVTTIEIAAAVVTTVRHDVRRFVSDVWCDADADGDDVTLERFDVGDSSSWSLVVKMNGRRMCGIWKKTGAPFQNYERNFFVAVVAQQ